MPNVVPSPGVDETVSDPPAWRTMPCAVERPRPDPLPGSFVEKKGSKIRSCVVESMPTPVSATVTTAVSSSFHVLTVRRPPVGHRVAGVDDDVHQHLVDLHGVHLDREPVRVEAELELDVLADHAPEHRRELAHELVQVDDTAVGRLRPCERDQLADERCSALRGGGDRVAALVARLARRRRRESRRVAADHGEQVVEVVCDAGGDPAEQLEPLRLPELLLELALPGHVAEVALQHRGQAVAPRHEEGHVVDERVAAVGADEAVSGAERLRPVAGDPRAPGAEDALAVELVQRAERDLVEQTGVPLVAAHGLGPSVRRGEVMRAASRPRPKAATRPGRAGASPRRTRTSTETALTAPTAAALALFVRRERDGRTRGWSPAAFTPNVRPRPGDDMPCMSVSSRPRVVSGAWRKVRSVAGARCPPFGSILASCLRCACARRFKPRDLFRPEARTRTSSPARPRCRTRARHRGRARSRGRARARARRP